MHSQIIDILSLIWLYTLWSRWRGFGKTHPMGLRVECTRFARTGQVKIVRPARSTGASRTWLVFVGRQIGRLSKNDRGAVIASCQSHYATINDRRMYYRWVLKQSRKKNRKQEKNYRYYIYTICIGIRALKFQNYTKEISEKKRETIKNQRWRHVSVCQSRCN